MNKIWNAPFGKYYCLLNNTVRARHCNLLNQIKAFNYPVLSKLIHSTKSLNIVVNPGAKTNLAKDVIVFKYENPKFYKILNIFAICQFVFWNFLSYNVFTTLRDVPVKKTAENETLAWYESVNLGENKYRNGMTIFCFGVGYAILGLAWMFSLKSVRFLILRKGGEHVTLVTYGPFGKNRIMDVPLKCISAVQSRQAASSQLPLKIKNRHLYYILDMKGEFTNTQLFDHVIGLQRKF